MRRRLLLANVRDILKTQRGECGSIAPIIGILTELKRFHICEKIHPRVK